MIHFCSECVRFVYEGCKEHPDKSQVISERQLSIAKANAALNTNELLQELLDLKKAR